MFWSLPERFQLVIKNKNKNHFWLKLAGQGPQTKGSFLFLLQEEAEELRTVLSGKNYNSTSERGLCHPWWVVKDLIKSDLEASPIFQ